LARPRRESLAVRQRRVLEAARSVLIERGYHDVNLDDVARRAGISKGALYLYFKDKEDIIVAVLNDVIDRLDERLKKIPRPNGKTVSTLEGMASELLGFVDENQDFLIQFSREKPDRCGPKAGKVLQERFGRSLDQVSARVKACMKEGTLRSHDSSLGGLYFLSLVRMYMMQKILTQSKTPLRDHARALVDLFLNGLGKRE